MTEPTEHLHVDWDGPYTQAEVEVLNSATDIGVYQIYGAHPVYGANVLLYIGKTTEQTFGARISQHDPWLAYNQDAGRLEVYVGRLGRYRNVPPSSTLKRAIELVETLLICAHWPAANSAALGYVPEATSPVLHVLNWGTYRDLQAEVSSARYSLQFAKTEHYGPYQADDIRVDGYAQ